MAGSILLPTQPPVAASIGAVKVRQTASLGRDSGTAPVYTETVRVDTQVNVGIGRIRFRKVSNRNTTPIWRCRIRQGEHVRRRSGEDDEVTVLARRGKVTGLYGIVTGLLDNRPRQAGLHTGQARPVTNERAVEGIAGIGKRHRIVIGSGELRAAERAHYLGKVHGTTARSQFASGVHEHRHATGGAGPINACDISR